MRASGTDCWSQVGSAPVEGVHMRDGVADTVSGNRGLIEPIPSVGMRSPVRPLRLPLRVLHHFGAQGDSSPLPASRMATEPSMRRWDGARSMKPADLRSTATPIHPSNASRVSRAQSWRSAVRVTAASRSSPRETPFFARRPAFSAGATRLRAGVDLHDRRGCTREARSRRAERQRTTSRSS